MQGSIQEQGSAKQTENENCTEILSKKKKFLFIISHHQQKNQNRFLYKESLSLVPV